MKTQPMSSYPVYCRPAQPILPVSPRFVARPQLLTRLACLQSCQRWCRSTARLQRAFARAAIALLQPADRDRAYIAYAIVDQTCG